jgi:hypothetical protein
MNINKYQAQVQDTRPRMPKKSSLKKTRVRLSAGATDRVCREHRKASSRPANAQDRSSVHRTEFNGRQRLLQRLSGTIPGECTTRPSTVPEECNS